MEVVSKLDITKIKNNIQISIFIDFLNLITWSELFFLSRGTKRNLLIAPIPSKIDTKTSLNKKAFP